MNDDEIATNYADILLRIKEIRAQAIEHRLVAKQLANERRGLMETLIQQGVSQSQIARELGVTRQAIQKMLAR